MPSFRSNKTRLIRNLGTLCASSHESINPRSRSSRSSSTTDESDDCDLDAVSTQIKFHLFACDKDYSHSSASCWSNIAYQGLVKPDKAQSRATYQTRKP
ncbi:hypothetical protein MRX96_013135 [Rhipicephalus microplus]